MFRKIQPSVQWGICDVSVRYARAINKLIVALYDPTIPTSNKMFVVENKLMVNKYRSSFLKRTSNGYKMCNCVMQRLLLSLKSSKRPFFISYNDLILDVDLKYSPELHDRDDDSTLAPEMINI